jgi:hypothetical protein
VIGRRSPAIRFVVLGAVITAAIAFTGYYVHLVRADVSRDFDRAVIDPQDRAALMTLRRGPHIAFRNMEPGPSYGRLTFTGLEHRDGRLATTLSCNRIYFATRAGICLAVATHPAGYRAYLLTDSLDATRTLEIPGTPSRARVSIDGRLAAYTVFVGVDSYLAPGLSTRTRIVDLTSGRELADLEAFEVKRDGRSIHGADFNFWGVTFTRDSTRFYATFGTASRTYLVDGDLDARTLTLVADDIECPSLSPDGMRIAFKKKSGSGFAARWQPAILELSSKTVTLLPEPRHIDDQIEWLDNDHILYAVAHSLSAAERRSDVWMLARDGSSAPVRFLADAESPAVVRP